MALNTIEKDGKLTEAYNVITAFRFDKDMTNSGPGSLWQDMPCYMDADCDLLVQHNETHLSANEMEQLVPELDALIAKMYVIRKQREDMASATNC